ncbi:MAG: glycoside hydrolase family 25 protein [Clostridia bacterium]
MDNIFNKINSYISKKNIFTIIVIVLVACVSFTSLYVSFGTKKTTTDVLVPDEDVTINDDGTIEVLGSNGTTVIPNFDIPISTYSTDEFYLTDGVMNYTGGSSSIVIDVSTYQGEIDWATVKETGIDCAIIRCGYRGAVRGSLVEDSMYQTNIQGAIDNGIKVGVYFFSQATTEDEAEEEATFVLSLISQYNIDLPIVFDWEHVNYEDSRIASVTGDETSLFAVTFCKKIEKAGYDAMIYMNKDLAYNWYDLELVSDYPIWIAEYEETSYFYYDFEMWQYTDSGSVNGIDGKVDINISMKVY